MKSVLPLLLLLATASALPFQLNQLLPDLPQKSNTLDGVDNADGVNAVPQQSSFDAATSSGQPVPAAIAPPEPQRPAFVAGVRTATFGALLTDQEAAADGPAVIKQEKNLKPIKESFAKQFSDNQPPAYGAAFATQSGGIQAPSFGAAPSGQFGGGQQQQAAFGEPSSSPFGGSQQFGFGAPAKDQFGENQQPAFGASSSSPFGGSQQSGFGAPAKDQFGENQQPAFGASSSSKFGGSQQSGFGAPANDQFGENQQPAFGASSSSPFEGSQQSGFGAPTKDQFGENQKTSFGTSSSSQVGGSQQSGFGAPSESQFSDNQQPAFGASSTQQFGGNQQSGPVSGAESGDQFGGSQLPSSDSSSNLQSGGSQQGGFGASGNSGFGGNQQSDSGTNPETQFGANQQPNFGSNFAGGQQAAAAGSSGPYNVALGDEYYIRTDLPFAGYRPTKYTSLDLSQVDFQNALRSSGHEEYISVPGDDASDEAEVYRLVGVAPASAVQGGAAMTYSANIGPSVPVYRELEDVYEERLMTELLGGTNPQASLYSAFAGSQQPVRVKAEATLSGGRLAVLLDD